MQNARIRSGLKMMKKDLYRNFIMVARSSVGERGYHYILWLFIFFYIDLFFFSPHFLRRRKTNFPETLPHDVA